MSERLVGFLGTFSRGCSKKLPTRVGAKAIEPVKIDGFGNWKPNSFLGASKRPIFRGKLLVLGSVYYIDYMFV